MNLHGKDIKIFTANSNPQVAADIAKALGLPLGQSEVVTFSDGEVSVSIKESVRGSDVFVVQSTSTPVNDHVMELLIMIDAFKRASAGRITAVIPYMGYARQDRKAKARDPISAKLMADLLTVAGADRILTMDLHCAQIQGFFNIPVDHLLGVPILVPYFVEKFKDIKDNTIIVSPDLGSVTRARNFAAKFDAPLAIVDKRRQKANVCEVMNIIAIIPARMGSSRFPGKPLALIHGVPMVGHVAFRTAMSRCLSATYVATCDTVIEDYCKEAGLACVMTGDHHVRCSTRTAEALLKIEAATGRKADIVVMVQGDEPMVLPGMIDAAVEPMLKDPTINVVNLMADMDTLEEFEDPNEVKVVVDRNSDALYFSREPIPSRKKGADKVPMRKQVCIIPFRRDYLLKFNAMDECPLEICESVDMMRILEHGEKVRMVPTDARTWSVDTPEDLARVTRLMEGDALMREYAK